MSGHGPVPIKLHFQTQVGLWFADRRCRTCFSTVLPGGVRPTVLPFLFFLMLPVWWLSSTLP